MAKDPKKNGKKADLKKVTRLVTLAVFGVGFIMIGFTAWFIWKTLEGVSTADLGRRSSGTKVEGINMQVLDRLRAEDQAKGADAAKLPEKLNDPFLPSASAPEATPPAAATPSGQDLVPCPPPPPGTPPAPAGTPPCMMPASQLKALQAQQQQPAPKPPAK